MKPLVTLTFGILLTLLCIGTLTAPPAAFAQDHVVTPSDLRNDVAAGTTARQKNQAQLKEFVSSSEAEKAMKTAHIDADSVKNAVSQLSDDDLSQLSARSLKAQQDFAAGTLSNRDLIIILLAIVGLILIIVAVRR